MLRVGTSHFTSRSAAIRYYLPYFDSLPETREAVAAKLDSGEISLSPPIVRPGERYTVDREEGRYFIIPKQ